MSTSLNITRAVISVAATLAIAGCTDTNSNTNLNPNGPPVIQQVRITEVYATDMSGMNFNTRRVFGFGTHPMATAADEHPVTSAKATNQILRVIIDELLVGNALEEIACRAPVDSDAYARVPLGATPEDIAKCAVQQDLLPASCVGDHRVCLCELDSGCLVGTTMIKKGDPVGVLDVNQDGASDDTRFIKGSVGIKCGAIDVPIDLDASYWYPSGDQQVPATGGFEALGPAIVLAPSGPLPTNITCGLTFADDVLDKQGNKVCAGVAKIDPATNQPLTDSRGVAIMECTPGDLTAFTFKTETLRIALQGISNGDTGVLRTDPIIATTSAPVDLASLAGITMTEGGVAFAGFTVTLPTATTIRITANAVTGLAANTVYTITFPVSIKDTYGQPLPAPVMYSFTTGA